MRRTGQTFRLLMQALLTALKLVREERVYEDCGICANVGVHLDDIPNSFYQLMRKWPKFSGAGCYPVNGAHSYYAARKDGTLWDKSTDEGRLRFELLDYLIENVETMYNETNP